MSLLQSVFKISLRERKAVLYSFSYFFCLMCAYFILRPVRDEMGIQAGVDNMQWLFTGTFVLMLLTVPVFGYLMKRFPRRMLIPWIYFFFTINILLFYLAFSLWEAAFIATIFFIWLSVFNLFVISIFWSFNADIFSVEQAKRLFGPIAAGGSLGAISGPALTAILVGTIGVINLLLVSAFFLLMAIFFVLKLTKHHDGDVKRKLVMPIRGSVWQGILLLIRSPYLRQVSLFIFLYTCISTFLYFEQAHIVSNAFSSSANRTSYFGMRDLLVNSTTLFLQFFVTERILRKTGIIFCLLVVPMVASIGFFALGFTQSVFVLLIIQVVYRSLNFSIQRPSREVLFTKVGVQEKYNSKNFIDTALYRGGDAISGWVFAGLSSVIGSLQIISFLAIPIAVGWLISGFKMGKLFNSITSRKSNQYVFTKKSA